MHLLFIGRLPSNELIGWNLIFKIRLSGFIGRHSCSMFVFLSCQNFYGDPVKNMITEKFTSHTKRKLTQILNTFIKTSPTFIAAEID